VSRHSHARVSGTILSWLVLCLGERTETAGIQWPHVEDVDSLHLSEDLETLKTGGLFGVGGNGTGLRTRRKKVRVVLDLYIDIPYQQPTPKSRIHGDAGATYDQASCSPQAHWGHWPRGQSPSAQCCSPWPPWTRSTPLQQCQWHIVR
jgi:hypothetical protein